MVLLYVPRSSGILAVAGSSYPVLYFSAAQVRLGVAACFQYPLVVRLFGLAASSNCLESLLRGAAERV